MEVHHHSHSPRKKWAHYFWEFFMLFLAVTLGFFVENQREHYIEHQRAKVYAKGMLKNLQTDTAELKQIVERAQYAADYLDSFLFLVANNEINRVPTGKLCFYGFWGGYIRGFVSNDATFQQMKNSGSLRYFNSPELEQAIGEYDQALRGLMRQLDIDQSVYLETRKARARIFDYRYNTAASKIAREYVFKNYNQDSINAFISINPPLLTNDKIFFNEYVELCRSRSIRPQLNNAVRALELAKQIILLLQEKFHLR